MDIDDLIEAVVAIVAVVVIVGGAIWLISNTDWSGSTDTEPAEHSTYTLEDQAQQRKTDGHCSILADKCIVDEWRPICLLVDCIVDGRD